MIGTDIESEHAETNPGGDSFCCSLLRGLWARRMGITSLRPPASADPQHNFQPRSYCVQSGMLSTTLLPQTNLWAQLATGLGLLFLTRLFWQIFLSPLSTFPGPILAKVTNLWRVAQVHSGRAELKHIELHRRHGSVVRIGPNCLSISDPDLIKTIYSSRGA